jgi:hypothetical protein
MTRIRMALVACMAVYTVMCAGFGAQADAGLGVCVLGNGVSVDAPTSPVYAGVNVGQNSETDVYMTKAEYEEQCCAETNQPPDCFEPVSSEG